LLPQGFSAVPLRREFRIDKPNAPVAQGTEQRTSNPPVAGSNPAGRAPEFPAKRRKLKEPKLPVLGPVAAVGQQ
jgi:hypothetical protein